MKLVKAAKPDASVHYKVLKTMAVLSPMITQCLDSIFDALYFIKLRTEPRLIHVPTRVHVVQAVLLYTCELIVVLTLVTFFSYFQRLICHCDNNNYDEIERSYKSVVEKVK